MRFSHRLATAGAVVSVALVAPVALASSGQSGSNNAAAQQQCRTELKSMGKQAFKDAYGTNKNKSNAFGKCVSHRVAQNNADNQAAQSNAAKQCKALQSADPTGFANTYGTGKNKSNAFGKCVSQKAKALSQQAQADQVKAEDNAAKQCKTERSADPAAFKAKYGTNKNKSNAFGKCVSQKAKALEQQSSGS
jgi:hypothetical protein